MVNFSSSPFVCCAPVQKIVDGEKILCPLGYILYHWIPKKCNLPLMGKNPGYTFENITFEYDILIHEGNKL